MTDNNSNQADACNKYEDMPDVIYAGRLKPNIYGAEMLAQSRKDVGTTKYIRSDHHQALVQALEWAQEDFTRCGMGSHKVDDALAAAKMLDDNTQEDALKGVVEGKQIVIKQLENRIKELEHHLNNALSVNREFDREAAKQALEGKE